MMKKSMPAASPDAYIESLSGWQRILTAHLREAVRSAGRDLQEVIRWGHLVYFSNGPALLIRAEEKRVLFGFLRGKRLCSIDARLKASGKYELATMQLLEGDTVSNAMARRLTKEAIKLNALHGDPTKAATRVPKAIAKTGTKVRRVVRTPAR
jgi:hypothetical protein